MMIKKAVILAAGMGKRFQPITRVIPKPMLPIGNKPTLDYIIQELIESGIEQILIVVGHRKEIIEDYYRGRAEIHFVVQNVLNGTAKAVLLAEEFVNEQAFALCFSDEVIESTIPCIKQLMDIFLERKASMVTAIEATTEAKIHTYNAVEMGETQGKVSKLISIIEKPQSAYPSLFTSIGRYVIDPGIFNIVRSMKLEEERELYLTEAFNLLMKDNAVYGLRFEGKRWDIGTKEGWIETNVRLGLEH
jgi:UTP--glucose-1-phosphate uridylyltransferase